MPTIASKTIFSRIQEKKTLFFLNSRKLRDFMASLPSIKDIAKGHSSEWKEMRPVKNLNLWEWMK